jgi:hypothetical protein
VVVALAVLAGAGVAVNQADPQLLASLRSAVGAGDGSRSAAGDRGAASPAQTGEPTGSSSPSPTDVPSVSVTPSAQPSPSDSVSPSAGAPASPSVDPGTGTSTPPGGGAVPAPGTPDAGLSSTRAVDARLFGVHDAQSVGSGWPRGPVASLRVWDDGATWRQIETRPGHFEFGHLDRIVNNARRRGADVLIVLGQTPGFHAVRPGSDSFYGPGASSMPRMAAWKRYVYTVAKRYAGRNVSLQVWNEANVPGFWRGTPQQMAQLTKAAHDQLDRVSPRPRLVAPALVTRLGGQRAWLDRFYAQRVGGRPVASYVDVVSLQLYPKAGGTPEASMELLAGARQLLARHGVSKPIWNTEVNYGMTGQAVRPLPASRQAAYVGRTFLLNAANDVQRVYWYGWETQRIVNTRMVLSDGRTLTRGGLAFRVVRSWLHGARIGCAVDPAGTYTCALTRGGRTSHVYWNPKRTVTVRTPQAATSVSRLDGSRRTFSGGAQLTVGASPVLVR